jgi:hypothetical protein
MTKIVVTTKKPVLTQLGRLPKDVPVDIPQPLATFLIERGDAVLFETKEAMDRPYRAAGMEEPLSALPVAQASPMTTLNESESGVKPKRRGRPPKALSLQTPPTE